MSSLNLLSVASVLSFLTKIIDLPSRISFFVSTAYSGLPNSARITSFARFGSALIFSLNWRSSSCPCRWWSSSPPFVSRLQGWMYIGAKSSYFLRIM